MKLNNKVLIAFFIIAGCITGNNIFAQSVKQKNAPTQTKAGPPAIVYKTRKDYSNNVPVLLSEDKTKVVSYPDPQTIRSTKNYPVPTQLKKGYLLDNRGIDLRVAYLKMTYKEYAALPKAPTHAELMEMIIDKNPLTELINCGSRYNYKNVVTDLNNLIQTGKLRKVGKVMK